MILILILVYIFTMPPLVIKQALYNTLSDEKYY